MNEPATTQEGLAFYVVVVFACDINWCSTHGWAKYNFKNNRCIGEVRWRALRGYEKRSSAAGFATLVHNGGNTTAQVRECYPMEGALLHGTVDEKYVAAERAIEEVGKRAAELERAVRAPVPRAATVKKPRRKLLRCAASLEAYEDGSRGSLSFLRSAALRISAPAEIVEFAEMACRYACGNGTSRSVQLAAAARVENGIWP